MTDLNPQEKQMSDESMVRNLDAQARAIWPQESRLFASYNLSGALRILDAGCGTGEATSRLAALYPQASVLGVDILESHLALARARSAALGSRVTFERQSIFELPAANATYDLVVCRHVLHSVPFPERVLAELTRVLRPGGWIHLIPEDYGMLHFQNGTVDVGRFWREVPVGFGAGTQTDLFVGRNSYSHLVNLGLQSVSVEYVIVDTLKVPRATFAEILTAWRDGYVESIAELTSVSADQARAAFDQMIADIRDPSRYAAWMVPVVAGQLPER